MEDGRIHATAGSDALDVAVGLAWLWRLGPVLGDPDARAVGFGTIGEAAELHAHVRSGALRGAVVFAPEPGPSAGPVPRRRAASGRARFESGASLDGTFTVVADGRPVVRSSVGVHATLLEPRTLVVCADPTTGWTRLAQYWLLEALAPFLTGVLDRPLVLLPPIGCVR